MSMNSLPRYQIPTHLDTPDTIDLPLFGMTVSVTMRQGICYLVGWSLAFHLWQQSLDLSGLLGVLHWAIPVLLAFLTYVMAVHEIHGRHLEYWTVVLFGYLSSPKIYVWRNVLLDEAITFIEQPEPSDEPQNDEEEI